MPDRFRTLSRDTFDVIVVGAGLGGLSAAALLARHGAQVLVIDRHYVAGGNATIFKRRGYEFEVGLHAISGCEPYGLVPRLLRAVGAPPIEFEELDRDGFDTLIFPDFTFRIPMSVPAFRRRLLEQFPGERRGIDRYVSLVELLAMLQRDDTSVADLIRMLPQSMRLLRWANSTYKAFLDTCTKDERLQAVLASQNGDYALPPSRASCVIGLGLVSYYLGGVYVPKGGGQVLSDRLADAIEQNGGKILLRTGARRILIERGRTVGVEIESKHLGVRVVRARTVISNADLKQTMETLVGEAHLKPKTLERTRAFEMSPALGAVYLGLKRDLRAEGHARTNYWVHPSYDLEKPYAAVARGEIPDAPVVGLSISSVKDPTNSRAAPPGMTNLQLIAIAPAAPESWGVTEAEVQDGSYRKSPAYQQRKQQFSDSLIESTRRLFPSLREDIAYCEVATPLTHRRFTSSTGGTSYGIACTPQQFLWNRPTERTEIEGLYITGASCRMGPGIVAAMTSGTMVAAALQGRSIVDMLPAPPEPRTTGRLRGRHAGWEATPWLDWLKR